MQDIQIDVIISSSGGRAYDTANLIRGSRNIEIVQSDNLREMYLGEWEGQTPSEIRRLDKEQEYNFWHKPHQYRPTSGESYEELKCRVTKVLTYVVKELDNKTVLIVTHAITLKTILAYVKNMEIKDIWSGIFMHPTCLSAIEVSDGVTNTINEGDISHYR